MNKGKIEKIKQIYKNDFGKEIESTKLQSYSFTNIDKMSVHDLYPIYSPLRIFNEKNNIIKESGKNDFNTKEKYKKLRELLLVSILSLTFNKYNLGKWYIKSDEAPDIKLHKFNEQIAKGGQGFFQDIEIMFIVERVTSQWIENIETEITNFIKDKKFLKSYGHNTSLFVSISFNQIVKIKFDNINELFRKDDVPFKQIWILSKTPKDEEEYNIFEVYPYRNNMIFNFNIDRKYFF